MPDALKLEALQPDCAIRGIRPAQTAAVVGVKWRGSDALTLLYRSASGGVSEEVLYRDDEARLELVFQGRPWSFDGARYRLVAEAHRIRLAHLFDAMLAVHSSLAEPLPHQIAAVYEAMLPRQPLRFLLADDPGAGKTVMAGLLVKELIARGDLQRCLIACPDSLVEQWQDELHRRFDLHFELLTNDKPEAARTGNWFVENDLAIARLDKLARSEEAQAKLSVVRDCRYDLVICDEARTMSATFFGGDIGCTRRCRLGRLLSGLARHFLGAGGVSDDRAAAGGAAVRLPARTGAIGEHRHPKVLDATGKPMSVRAALALINEVLDEVLADSRWTLAWFDQHGFDDGGLGVAEVLSKAEVTSGAGLVEAGIARSKAGKIRLLKFDGLPEDWDPATDPRLTTWEMVHHLIRVLKTGGETAVADLAKELGGKAETARELCYRLYTLCERSNRAAETYDYNTLPSWPEIMRLAREAGQAEQSGLFEAEQA